MDKSGRSLRSPTSGEWPLIAIDLGGTIEDSWQSKRSWFASRGFDLGRWPRSREEVIQLIGGRPELYEQMVAEVYNDENVLSHEPVEGVASALEALATEFKIIIVSSRIDLQRATTLEWLELHRLSPFIHDIALLGADTNKLVWCLRAGVQVLIDDDIRHLEPRDTISPVTRIHFSARPLNAHRTREGILVAASWQEIVPMILAPRSIQTNAAGVQGDR